MGSQTANGLFKTLKETRFTSVLASSTITLAFCKPINAINKPRPTLIALRTSSGMALKMCFLSPVAVRIMNITPSKSVNTIQLANVKPVFSLHSVNTIKALTPIPEACASGIFARKAIKNVPTIAPSAVAM